MDMGKKEPQLYFYSLSLNQEEYASERAKKSINSLLKLVPEKATLKEEKKNVNVHFHAVKVGDLVVVRPGDRIPLDGLVMEGNSVVNQANITGESMPVTKNVGEEVQAGIINQEEYLEVKVTKKSDETVLSKIIKL